ncbi:MAG: hypothetical protein ABW049_09040 [Spongiibacteraceae bacterium]
MRIGSSLPLLPTTVSDRGYGSARSSRPPEAIDSAAEQAPRGEVTRIRSRVASAASDPSQSFSDRDLPQRSRDALQSYQANGPTLSERLGVELAGIDVLV